MDVWTTMDDLVTGSPPRGMGEDIMDEVAHVKRGIRNWTLTDKKKI